MKDAEKFLKRFPKLTEKLEKEIRQTHRRYILFNHKGQAYCTACEKEIADGNYLTWDGVHKAYNYCPNCGNSAEEIDVSKNYSGTKTYDIGFSVVYLAGEDGNLYARCFKQEMRFAHNQLRPIYLTRETQRYVFTPNGSARFGSDYSCCTGSYEWNVRSKMTYPNFEDYGYYISRVYRNSKEINLAPALKSTWLKYSAAQDYADKEAVWGVLYLVFYRKHEGVERLWKCGFSDIRYLTESPGDKVVKSIKWGETEVHKMLGISKSDLRFIRETGHTSLRDIFEIKSLLPGYPLEDAFAYRKTFNARREDYKFVINHIGLEKVPRLAKYISKQLCSFGIYKDYIDFCDKLGFDLSSSDVLFPPHLEAAHDRAYSAVEAEKLSLEQKQIQHIIKIRKKFEFRYKDLIIRLPRNPHEIVLEGQALRHCVGGYAERHFLGKTTILFIRKNTALDTPYFTIEVDNDNNIVQCHGYRNEFENAKPDEIKELEAEYKKYLSKLKNKAKGTKKQPLKIGA